VNIADAITEIQQPRSRFQLVHFVIGQHDTPEMRFYQLCLELQDMGCKLRKAQIAVRKSQVEIARLLATGDELDALEAEEKQVDLEQTRIVMRGAERELAVLTDLFDESQKFTRDEIEHAQPEYWKARLTRQTNLQLLSGNVDVGQLTSLHNAGLLDELIAEREQHLTNGHQELHP
jgi:hypothetical protein|tara:strand:+ start:2160 stop:2687 length:528 start_codon:yes stop_codon:yes gene_type:complete